MDDSFSRLAKQIRRSKINKYEIKKIKREIIDGKVLNLIKIDMAIKIQKHIRGFIYRKKYKIILEQNNTEIIINYLHEKKLTRIKYDYRNIISFHVLNYIKHIKEEKEKINLKKINSINKIKAIMKGIIFRKHFKNKNSLLGNKKETLEKYILSYKVKLILRSNNIQSLLIDIANIKYSLNNLDKNNDISNQQKIKELKTKLNKNINLFYFTFYQMKENSNWISQTKISEPWLKKYLEIINKNKNIFVKKKSIYSNQKKLKKLKENNSNKNHEKRFEKRRSGNYLPNSLYKNNNTINTEKEISISNFETESNNINKRNKLNGKYLLSEGREKTDKSYNFNFYDSESDELNNNTNANKINDDKDKDTEKNNKNISNKETKDSKSQSQNSNETNDKKIRNDIIKRYRSRKSESEKLSSNKSKSPERKESLNIKINEYKIDDTKEDNNLNLNFEKKASSNINPNKNLNKYQQIEERPIKPMKNINFLENDNPFGLKRDSNSTLTESNKNKDNNIISPIQKQKSLEKRSINSTRAINSNLIAKEKKNNISELDKDKEEMVKTQEKTDLSHDELPVSNKYIEYDNRPVGPNNSNNININKEFDRNERPIGGIKNIDYNAMFGEGGEFDGDPFGGAKQVEKNNKKEKNKINHNNNNNLTKKKPVYDARKAIEEAKLKEAKEGKKEKPSAFREFLREMKKISAEEKTQHNETNNNIENNNNNFNSKMNKKNKNSKNKEKEISVDLDKDIKFKFKDNKLFTEKKEENSKNFNNIIELDHKENKENNNNQKKINKQNETKEISLRRKLHELEKAPAPILNIKGVKSKIECWGGNNENKKTKNNNLIQREMPKSKDEKKSKNNKLNKKLNEINLPDNNKVNSNNNSSNNIPKINKIFEEKIEKYVEQKLMQLSLQIEEIDELFNLDKYYEEKNNKMKKYINLPYIKKDYEFVVKYNNDNYKEKIEKIKAEYKELK